MNSMKHDGLPATQAGSVPETEQGVEALPTVGRRLREAREAVGLARDEFARRAHIPAAVLANLEEDRGERLGAPVFVRGYLRSAARAAGLADDAFLDAMPKPSEDAPPLVAQRIGPTTPRWVTRYATPVAYALLTAVVMVPLVYLARPNVTQVAQTPSLTSIDGATRASGLPVDTVALAGPATDGPQPTAAPDDVIAVGPPAAPTPAAGASALASPGPVMASLAPLPQSGMPTEPRRVTLRLAVASWVEFTGADGSRLEYALLPAGTQRDYQLSGSAELRIGNASAAQLTVDGRAVDLAPLSSPNDVARVQLGEPPAPPAD